jgi:hypothetical protein
MRAVSENAVSIDPELNVCALGRVKCTSIAGSPAPRGTDYFGFV